MSKGRTPAKPREIGPADRQPRETAKAFQAFRCYLEMGPSRSTAKVAQALGKSKTLTDRWSGQWNWVERVKLDEAAATSRADDERHEVIAKRSRRQAEIAQMHQEVTASVGQELLQRITKAKNDGTESPLEKLSFRELLALEGTMARAHARVVVTERLALGITTEQPGEPLPRSEAEEAAARLSEAELEARLTGLDELAPRRAKRTSRKKATG